MKRITIKDVAKDAGVSITIASFAMNNVKGRVSDEVRERVLESAKRLGYIPNTFAKGLRMKSSNTIALVYDEAYLQERNSSTLQFVASALKHARKLGKDVLIKLFSMEDDWRRILDEYMELWASQRVEGFLLQTGEQRPELLSALKEKKVNFVTIPGLEKHTAYSSVGIDNFSLMRDAVGYLKTRGYEEVFFLTMKRDVQTEREKGYLEGAGAHRIKGEVLYYLSEHRGKGELWSLLEPVIGKRSGKLAIACWNDVDAMNVIDILHSQGIRIPGEVGVLGFDDLPASEHTTPPLTTIRQPFEEMARQAVELLIEQYEEKAYDRVRNITVPGELVIRESV